MIRLCDAVHLSAIEVGKVSGKIFQQFHSLCRTNFLSLESPAERKAGRISSFEISWQNSKFHISTLNVICDIIKLRDIRVLQKISLHLPPSQWNMNFCAMLRFLFSRYFFFRELCCVFNCFQRSERCYTFFANIQPTKIEIKIKFQGSSKSLAGAPSFNCELLTKYEDKRARAQHKI